MSIKIFKNRLIKTYKVGAVKFAFIIVMSWIVSCDKLVEVQPPVTSTNGENVYTNDLTAAAVLTGVYAKLGSGGYGVIGPYSISVGAALSADELTLRAALNDQRRVLLYRNNLLATPSNLTFWNNAYNLLLQVNSAIEGVSLSNSLSESVRNQLLGEAKFMRAFTYFYLVNFFGDVPLVLGTDYNVNRTLPRTPKSGVYSQIIADLKDAQVMLSNDFLGADLVTPTSERVRPTKWAATALLSRVYLYTNDWPNAEAQATSIISNSSKFKLVSTNDVFKKNSQEAIWQVQPTNTGWNTEDARVFILPSNGPSNLKPAVLSSFLLNSFESNDQRRSSWVNSITVGANTLYYPYKYKSATQNAQVTEYNMILRLAEQYLIRAEARAMQGKLQSSIDDVNEVRTKHGGFSIPILAPSTQASAISIILHERQVELFTEWGHRWLDLKRTETIDAIMSSVVTQKGGTWESTDKLWPIPLYDIQQNPNILQNPGY